MIDTEMIKQMCRLFNRNQNCKGCPLSDRTLRCNVNLASASDIERVEEIVNNWEMPTNGSRFIETFGEDAYKRLCRTEEFARWAAEP
jgi:hypothetical protein